MKVSEDSGRHYSMHITLPVSAFNSAGLRSRDSLTRNLGRSVKEEEHCSGDVRVIPGVLEVCSHA